MEQNTQHSNPLEVFLGICSLVLTVVVAFATGGLLFSLINETVADPLAMTTYAAHVDTIRYTVAVLVITFPLLLASRHYLKRIADSRGWMLKSRIYDAAVYLVLFGSGATVVGDLIAVLFNFLRGEATGRFILKALVVLVISALVFQYYLIDRRRRESQWKESPMSVPLIEGTAVVMVLAGILAGFFVAGGPGNARLERYDEARVGDLVQLENAINWYADTFEELPVDTTELTDAARAREPYYATIRLNDPVTEVPYVYTPTIGTEDEVAYTLCGTFDLASAEEEPYIVSRWDEHGVGEVCEDVIYDLTEEGFVKPRFIR